MTELPSGWTEVSLGEIAKSVKNGIFVSRPGAEPSGVPILRISAVRPGVLQLNDVRYSAMTADELARSDSLLIPGDLLFTRYNGNMEFVGACAIVPHGVDHLTYPDKLIRVKIDDRIAEPAYIKYAFQSPMVRSQVRSAARTTAGQAGISGASLKAVRLPLPPIAEQRRIVAGIEQVFFREAYGSGFLDRSAARLLQMREVLLADAVSGLLSRSSGSKEDARERRSNALASRQALVEDGKRGRPHPVPAASDVKISFPTRWPVMSMEEVTHPVRTISYGILKPGPNLPDGIPYVRVINMRGDCLALSDLHRTSPEIESQYSRARLVQGDVIISIRGTFGRVVRVPPELEGANITQDSARLAFLECVDPDFACIYLRSPQVQKYLQKIAKGVAVKGVNIGDIRVIPFPLPSLAEQREIVAMVDRCLSQQKALADSIVRASVRAKRLRGAILAEAFAGRLAPQDPNDELASDLLARIRAESTGKIPKQCTRSRRTSKDLPAPPTRVTGGDYEQEALPL